jgi:hypothetical protein
MAKSVYQKRQEKLEQEWEGYISGGKHKVMMDNDGWWFCPIEDDENGDAEWVSGGDGPYGRDLLEYMLKRVGIEMEGV